MSQPKRSDGREDDDSTDDRASSTSGPFQALDDAVLEMIDGVLGPGGAGPYRAASTAACQEAVPERTEEP